MLIKWIKSLFKRDRHTPDMDALFQHVPRHANDQDAYRAEVEAHKRHINKRHEAAMKQPVGMAGLDRRLKAARDTKC